MASRIKSIDIAKGIGILLVVLGQSVASDSCVKAYIYSFHMPLFFVLAGMVVRPLSESGRSLGEEFARRAKALLLPYVIACAAFTPLSIKGILAAGYASREMLFAVGGVSSLWFLPVLFVSNLLVVLAICCRRVVLVGCVCLCVGFVIPHLTPYGWPWSIDVCLVAAGFVAIGYEMKLAVGIIKSRWLLISAGVVLLLVPLLCCPKDVNFSPGYVSMWKNHYINVPMFIVSALSGSAGVFLLARGIESRWSNFISLLGQSSLWIFILHKSVLDHLAQMSIVPKMACAVIVPVAICLTWRVFVGRVWVLISPTLQLALDSLWVPIVLFMPRNRRKILFGSYLGRQYSCNPRYLFEYFVKRGGYRCVWIGEKRLREDVLAVKGAEFVAKGSIAAVWHCLTAKFYVYNVNWESDIMRIPICRRVIPLYLTHGTPSKKTGVLQLDGHGGVPGAKSDGLWLVAAINRFNDAYRSFLFSDDAWTSVTSPQGEDFRLACMPFRLARERMIRCGTPRFDFMIHHAKDENLRRVLREKYARILGLPEGKRWILYAPTWRHNSANVFSFTKAVQSRRFQEQLEEDNSVLIEKHHPIILESRTIQGGQEGGIFVISRDQSLRIDMQELLLASDRLITDYSSIYYDFYRIDRPVIHYIYDYDRFMNVDMGFNFDIREYGGGPFAKTEDELLSFLGRSDGDLLSMRTEKTREHLVYETGHACEGYYQLLERLANE